MYPHQAFTDRIGSCYTQESLSLNIRPWWSDSVDQPNGIINLPSALQVVWTYENTSRIPRLIANDLASIYNFW